jgi:hypothetical protein
MAPSVGIMELLCLARLSAATFFVPIVILALVYLQHRRPGRVDNRFARRIAPAE